MMRDNRMNARIKDLWVAALRSGKYRQTKRVLADKDGYCCLGVLCEVAIQDGMNLRVDPNYHRDDMTVKSYDGATTVPPQKVWMDWAGMPEANPYVAYSSLATLNDGGKSFKFIADIIEREL
jgi:hypothetical protein